MESRLSDASPGRAAGLPLAVAAVVILVVVLVLILRARRARRAPRPDPRRSGPDQLDDGSGGQ
jgi:hypothetical protein